MAQYDLGKVSIRPRGAYAANTNYEFLDSVQNLGGSWLALAASKDVQPGVTAGWQNYWMMITRGIKTIVGSSPADGQTKITITFTDGATATYTYNNEVLADGSVTQSKLSVSGRCGSVISASAGKNLENSDAGNTYYATWTSTGSVRTWTLNAELSAAISNGFAIAFTELWPSDKTRISISGVRLLHRGEGQLLGKSQSAVLGLVERCNMIALQKMITDAANGDVWLLTGDVEVVS